MVELETTMINMLKALMGRLDCAQKQMGDVARGTEMLREKGKQRGTSKARTKRKTLHWGGLKKGDGEARMANYRTEMCKGN